MQRRVSFILYLYLSLGMLGLTGCPKKPATEPEPTADDGVRVVIAPESDSFPAWEEATARVVLQNTGKRPVLVLAAKLTTGLEEPALDRDTTKRYPAKPDDDDQVIEGQYLIENIEPMLARAPKPPHWKWEGERKLVTLALVPPGGRMDWQGRFRARYEAEPALEAEVVYVVPTDPVRIYHLEDTQSKTITYPAKFPALRTNPGVWRVVEELKVVYSPYTGELEDGTVNRSAGSHEGVELYPYAVTDVALAGLKRRKATAKTPLRVDRKTYDIGDARSACGIAHGPYTFAVALDQWVIAGEDQTCFAGPDSHTTVTGLWVGLADELNDEGKKDIVLFTHSRHPDPDGHVKFLERQGFDASSKLQKGMVYDGVVTVEGADLLKLAQALAERGIQL